MKNYPKFSFNISISSRFDFLKSLHLLAGRLGFYFSTFMRFNFFLFQLFNVSVSKCLSILQSSRLYISTFKRFHVSAFLRFIFLLFTFHLLLFTISHAQVLTEDMNNPVYKFIEKFAVKKIIDVNQSVKPYSKNQIAKWLKQIQNSEFRILNLGFSRVEQEELEWYLEEYDLERDTLIDKFGQFTYNDNRFNFRAVPILGYEISGVGNKDGFSKHVGAHLEGNYENISLMFEYLDTGEFGDNVDIAKNVTPKTGHFIKGAPNGIEFSDVKGRIGYDFGYGSLSLKKEYVIIGSGQFGQLIHSSKAASYPHIELKLKPADWLEIYYMHGFLNSQVLDSNNFYYSYQSEIEPRLVESFISKYIALNYITIMPNDWLKLSLGNSHIYSGDIRPEMFIPIMYYKVMDHNTGRGSVNDGNGMIFFDLNFNYFKNINFYSTFLIDVLEIRPLLEGDIDKSWLAFTFGSKIMDIGISKLNLFFEYSRLNPWIYDNKYSTTTYKHLNYVMGHWVGNNADILSIQMDYKFIRSLQFSLKLEMLRKGGEEDNYYAYEERIGLPFLFGERRNDFRIEFFANYSPLHNVYLKGKYIYSEIEDELVGRTPSFLLGAKNSFCLSLSYGLP